MPACIIANSREGLCGNLKENAAFGTIKTADVMNENVLTILLREQS